jgi:tellurite resistance protein TerB
MFGMLKKTFGKGGSAAKEELKKIENRDLMQAICGASLLIAAADGDIEASETAKLEAVIRALPALAHFGAEISQTVQRFTDQLNAGLALGKLQIMREIRDCKHSQQEAEDIFVVALTVAQSDGEIEEAEQKVLVQIARELGVNPRDYGLE